MSFSVPVKDMLFAMEHLANLDQVAQIPGFEDANLETAQAVLEECAKLCEGVIEPLNIVGDKHPSSLNDGVVTTTAGFKEAFAQFAEGGWQGLQHPVDFGGQGLPKTIGAACLEMLNSANLSFALCPLLTDGAIEALLMAGSDELKAVYLEKLISGQWTGTMNLTEPQAGSDLSLVRTKAEPLPDGSYKIFGTKIFITYGEHDMAENIVHLVLARVAGAPEGVKGISLFVVPKFLVNSDGSLGARNDAHCVSIEHKMGIKASPTAVLQFGDHGGAVGYLVGEENRGLEYMFIMMNAARYAVGMQGIAISERAYQKAVQYAKDRVQSRPVDGSVKASFSPVQVPGRASVNLATDATVPLTGDFEPGQFVELELAFSTGETSTLDVPVVKPCYQYTQVPTESSETTESSESAESSESGSTESTESAESTESSESAAAHESESAGAESDHGETSGHGEEADAFTCAEDIPTPEGAH